MPLTRSPGCASSSRIRLLIALLIVTLGSGCAGYKGALGYRARQAVLRGDVAAFDRLMAEAADASSKGPLDNPTKTVLSHFLDLGGSDRFFPMIEDWTKRGWVSELMTCAVQRARYKGVAARDPAEAERAARVCIDRARTAAGDPDRRWEIEACFDEAPFLVLTSTRAIAPYVALAADPREPYLFREGLLDGLTKVYLQDPGTRRANDPSLSAEAARKASIAQLALVTGRFRSILDGVRAANELELIRGATAFGALELERASLPLRKSFLASFLRSGSQDDADLTWGWVRVMKGRERIRRLDALGLWNQKEEPPGDAYWYLCAERPRAGSRAIAIVAKASIPDSDLEQVRQERCGELEAPGAPSKISGPYPLLATARAALTSSIASALGSASAVEITIARRLSL